MTVILLRWIRQAGQPGNSSASRDATAPSRSRRNPRPHGGRAPPRQPARRSICPPHSTSSAAWPGGMAPRTPPRGRPWRIDI